MNNTLKVGDILLYEPNKKSFVDQCIIKITKGDVCHAAMVYSTDSYIEMNVTGIGVYGMSVKEGRRVHVMRHKNVLDEKRLVQSANGYIYEAVRYDFPALFLLAGLLVYRNTVRHDIPDFSIISEKIITAAIVQLDKWLQQISHKQQKSLICSQLVYQIYNDCGEGYQIKMDGILPENIQLADALDNENLEREMEHLNISDFDLGEALEKTEELAEELLRCLNDAEHVPTKPIHYTPIHNLIFHKKLVDLTERLEISITPESLFVMPNDLLHHSLNLSEVGTCEIVSHV